MKCAYNALTIGEHKLIPIVQGGMGIGVSAHRLASAVARENGMGTIASVDLRHLHPDLLAQSLVKPNEDMYNQLNRQALDREVTRALQDSQGKGMIAVNVMKAVKDHAGLIKQACISGAHGIVMGAGLPLELPDITQDFPKVKLLPILSESRGVGIVLKRWMKKNRLPDAIVIEHPAYAAGHLGAMQLNDLRNEKFEFTRVIPEVLELFKNLGLESEPIPLIVAGGMASYENIHCALTQWGVSGVQLGSAFAVTHEGDAHENFKNVLLNSTAEEMIEFMSVAGLPARGVNSQFLQYYLKREAALQANAKPDQRRCVQKLNCLSVCGLRDGIASMGQFCIDQRLSAAWRGEVKKGLFFKGNTPLPFGRQMKTVKETIHYLLFGRELMA